MFGQVLMVGQQVRTESGQSRLRHWTGALVLPVQSGVHSLFDSASRVFRRYVWTVRVGEENRELEAQADRLRMENHFLRQALLRYEELESLNAYRVRLESKTLPATVIGQGSSRIAKEIFLDRGGSDGVRSGMAVIVSEGIVGKTGAVYPRSSMVVLISDSEAGAGVLLAGSGEPGVLRGMGSEDCRIDYIGPQVPVSVGEFVYTSGLDGVFPRGLPVGRVIAVEDGVEAKAVRVRPLADLGRLREVLVVVNGRHEGLPAGVQRAIADSHGGSAGRPGPRGARLLVTQADTVKQAYRIAVESQGTKVGALAGSGPPDFSGAARDLRASGSARPADSEDAE